MVAAGPTPNDLSTTGAGTIDPAGVSRPAGTIVPAPLVAMDFGSGGNLCLYGGPLTNGAPGSGAVVDHQPVPRLKAAGRGSARSDAEKFVAKLELLLQYSDVVCESATVGSSGAETEAIEEMLARVPHQLFCLPTRAVKNWRMDHPSDVRAEVGWRKEKGLRRKKNAGAKEPASFLESDDEQAARVLHAIATHNPRALRPYRPKPVAPLDRVFTSVRPSDKRGYRGTYAGVSLDDWIGLLPPFCQLPTALSVAGVHILDLQALLGDPWTGDYRRAVVFPFALALAEPCVRGRRTYEKVLGLYGHGYPSFYRRATVDLMHDVALALTGKERFRAGARKDGTVTPGVSVAERKEAWRATRTLVRYLFTNADRERARLISRRATPAWARSIPLPDGPSEAVTDPPATDDGAPQAA